MKITRNVVTSVLVFALALASATATFAQDGPCKEGYWAKLQSVEGTQLALCMKRFGEEYCGLYPAAPGVDTTKLIAGKNYCVTFTKSKPVAVATITLASR